jgi:hypothetical protein
MTPARITVPVARRPGTEGTGLSGKAEPAQTRTPDASGRPPQAGQSVSAVLSGVPQERQEAGMIVIPHHRVFAVLGRRQVETEREPNAIVSGDGTPRKSRLRNDHPVRCAEERCLR